MSQASRTAVKLAFVASSNSMAPPMIASTSAAVASSSTNSANAANEDSSVASDVVSTKAVHPFFAKRKRDDELDALSQGAGPSSPAFKKASNEQALASATATPPLNISPPVIAPFRLQWQASKPAELLHALYGPPVFSPKLACFDVDGTLIEVKSGGRFPKSATDWNWWDAKGKVQSRLIEYHRRGYSIIFVSNQNYAPHTKPHQNFKAKMPLVCASLNNNSEAVAIPVRIFAATAKDNYRKPNIGIWTLLEQLWKAQGVSIDKKDCFYVGDAAGRKASHPGMKHKERDHNDTDKGWATNAGINFYTPEEFFWQRLDEMKDGGATGATGSSTQVVL